MTSWAGYILEHARRAKHIVRPWIEVEGIQRSRMSIDLCSTSYDINR